MKRFLLFFLLAAPGSWAQIPEYQPVFREDFEDNRHFWPLLANDLGVSKITNGHYVLERKQPRSYLHFTKNILIHPDQDFFLEASLREVSGDRSQGYGIVFGRADYQNLVGMNLRSTGEFMIYVYDHGNQQRLVDWTHGPVLGQGSFNKISVQHEGGTYYFYINDEKVYAKRDLSLYGQSVGFEVRREKKVEVDYFLLEREALTIPLLPAEVTTGPKENLGLAVNSPFLELAPIISPDGNTLYYCRTNHPGNEFDQKSYEIWSSTEDSLGHWSKAVNMGGPLNNRGANWVVSALPGGNSLVVSGIYHPNGQPKGDGVSLTERTTGGWSLPQPIRIEDFYNRGKYSSYALSANGKVLLMGLEREDGLGANDLYVSFQKPDSTFTAPLHMGPQLNTFANDFTPFIAADMRTLYFSSLGHPGYGDADIFMSTRLDSTWQKWTEPVNLGPEINSSNFDSYFSIPASGDYAYLVSYENSYGTGDIFRVPIHPNARPKPVMLVKGTVREYATNLPLDATIYYTDLETGDTVGSAIAHPSTGSYTLALPQGLHYGIFAEKEKHLPVSHHVDLRDMTTYSELEWDLFLHPITDQGGMTLALNNLFFDYNKAELKPQSFEELGRFASVLKANPLMVVEIAGHTDAQGTEAYNLALSSHRAEAVVEFMVSLGVEPTQLQAKGYGETQPKSLSDPAKNRRVEFRVVKVK